MEHRELPYEAEEDEALIGRLREGDSAILDFIMEKYKGMVRKRAREMFLVGGEPEDLIQEGMIGLFKAVRDYRSGQGTSFQTFARLCIDRQIYTAVQNSNRQKHKPLNGYVSLSDGGDEALQDNWSASPETILIAQEDFCDRLSQIRSRLSPLENSVLSCFIEGSSYEKIADELGLNRKSVDNAMKRIREKIRMN